MSYQFPAAAEEEVSWADRQPMVVRCSLSTCTWSFEGPAGEARAKAAEHRALSHGFEREPLFPMQGFKTEEVEMDAGLEALDRMDRGEQQEPLGKKKAGHRAEFFSDRFAGKYSVDSETGCWIWEGSLVGDGYGEIWSNGKMLRAHRVAWEIANGKEVPEGMVLDHVCKRIACVNPEHLEVVTPRENTLRGDSPAGQHARKTHCPQGHPYDEENTYSDGRSRFCRICRAERRSNGRQKHTRESIVQAIRDYAAEHGHAPSSSRKPGNGLAQAARRLDLKWPDLISEAGVTPAPIGNPNFGNRAAAAGQKQTRSPGGASPKSTRPKAVKPSTEVAKPEPQPPATTEKLRDPIRTADIPYDANRLEEEAAFLRRRADAMDELAAALRKFEETSS